MTDSVATAGADTTTPDQAKAAPVKTASRIGSLDFIRGIAVMGILAANIVAFGQPFVAYMYPDAFAVPHGEGSDWLWVAQFMLIDGKMRGLFTLLFGAGMYLFMERAWGRGQSRWLQARRLFWLLLFGLFHFYLIWRGDILLYYAVFGFVVMLALRWAAKTQLVVGIVTGLLGCVFFALFTALPYVVAETPVGEQAEFADMREELASGKALELAYGEQEIEIIQNQSYPDYVRYVWTEHADGPLFGLMLFGFETIPLMLLGMAFYRYGLFSGGMDPGKQRRWGWIGIIVGSLLTLPIALWAKSIGLTYWGTLAAFMGLSPLPRYLVVFGLAALLALYGAKASGWLAERISAAGRAAFTNYLGTSVLMMLVFHGWGLGLFAELNRAQLYLVVLGAWVVMLAWSKPWLETFRYGPLEWLWRCLTYGKLFPLRR